MYERTLLPTDAKIRLENAGFTVNYGEGCLGFRGLGMSGTIAVMKNAVNADTVDIIIKQSKDH